MARVMSVETKVSVIVSVTYVGRFPLDVRRKEFIEQKLQAYADGDLQNTLRQLRYSDEPEGKCLPKPPNDTGGADNG